MQNYGFQVNPEPRLDKYVLCYNRPPATDLDGPGATSGTHRGAITGHLGKRPDGEGKILADAE